MYIGLTDVTKWLTLESEVNMLSIIFDQPLTWKYLYLIETGLI